MFLCAQSLASRLLQIGSIECCSRRWDFADCTSEKNRDDFSVSSYASSNELLTPADVWGYWMQNGSNFVLFLEGKAIIIQIQLCQ